MLFSETEFQDRVGECIPDTSHYISHVRENRQEFGTQKGVGQARISWTILYGHAQDSYLFPAHIMHERLNVLSL